MARVMTIARQFQTTDTEDVFPFVWKNPNYGTTVVFSWGEKLVVLELLSVPK